MFKFRMLLLLAVATLLGSAQSPVLAKKELLQKKLARMEGMVTDIGKFPVSDAAVTVQRLEEQGNSPMRVEVKTGEDGRFVLDAIVPGKYEVMASHKGFKGATKKFSLEPGKVTKAVLTTTAMTRCA